MAINPMQRKSRNSFLIGVITTLLVCGVIIGILVFMLVQNKQAEEKEAESKKAVYILTRTIKSGDKIEMADMERREIAADLAPATGLISPNIFVDNNGNEMELYAKLDLERGTIMTSNMIYEEKPLTKDVRVQQYNMIDLPTYLEVGDYIDIRLALYSGEDYLVVARKRIKEISATTVWIEMSEQETLTMSSAIYEAYYIKGLLYATVYVDAGIQGNGDSQDNLISVTYPVTSDVVALINSDPNIVTRASEGLREQRARIDAAREQYSDTAVQNIEQGVTEQVRKSQEERKKYYDELNGGY